MTTWNLLCLPVFSRPAKAFSSKKGESRSERCPHLSEQPFSSRNSIVMGTGTSAFWRNDLSPRRQLSLGGNAS